MQRAFFRDDIRHLRVRGRIVEILPVACRFLDFVLIIGEEFEMEQRAHHAREVPLVWKRLMNARAEATVVVPVNERILDQFQVGVELAFARSAFD
ncbi:hypothetical protein D3C86_1906430 [compost metagenome]